MFTARIIVHCRSVNVYIQCYYALANTFIIIELQITVRSMVHTNLILHARNHVLSIMADYTRFDLKSITVLNEDVNHIVTQ